MSTSAAQVHFVAVLAALLGIGCLASVALDAAAAWWARF